MLSVRKTLQERKTSEIFLKLPLSLSSILYPTMTPKLAPIDFVIMLLFFAAMTGMGVYFARRTKTTAAYFLGDNRIPSWAIGLSMVSTSISSVTFLAFPAAAFILDWRQVVPNLSNPLVAIIAVWLFVPFFRHTAKTSAFEYLHARYGSGARLYGSIMFLVGQSLRLGSILYLLAIPIQMITGISPFWIILLTGGFSAIYTILGGMEASIWTDVVQAVVLYLGGFAALFIMISGIPGGLGEFFQIASHDHKFSLGPMEWDLSERTFWTMLILGITNWVYGYAADQNMVQRYLSARSTHEARTATMMCALMSLPTWLFFFLLGTCLFVYYKMNPDPAVAGLPADHVFPHFIMTRMPAGLCGIVIAGVLSAAMGSLSSSLNAFATVSTVDILKPYVLKGKSDHYYTVLGRVMTGVGMVIMFAIGYGFLYAKKESFLDLSLKINGLLGGVVVCFFLLGFFAPRVNRKVVWQSFWVAITLNAYLLSVEMGLIPNFLRINIHPYWVSAFVITVMIVLALVLARIQGSRQDCPPELTIFSKR